MSRRIAFSIIASATLLTTAPTYAGQHHVTPMRMAPSHPTAAPSHPHQFAAHRGQHHFGKRAFWSRGWGIYDDYGNGGYGYGTAGAVPTDEAYAEPGLVGYPDWLLCQIGSRTDLYYACGPYSYHPFGAYGYRPYGAYDDSRATSGYVAAPNARIISIDGGQPEK